MRKMKHIVLSFTVLAILLLCASCDTPHFKENSQPTSTLKMLPTLAPPTPIPSITPTLPNTSTPTITPPIPTPTEFGVLNPQGILPAGMPVIVDDYVLVVDKSSLTIDDNFIGFSIQVRVLGDESRLFRYNASTLSLKDDLGNQYEYYLGTSRCTESDIYNAKQVQIPPGEKIWIEPQTSMMYSSYFWWCIEDKNQVIPGFQGHISPNAKILLLEFEGFGPFSGFGYQFDL